jgi:hypothetical protein
MPLMIYSLAVWCPLTLDEYALTGTLSDNLKNILYSIWHRLPVIDPKRSLEPDLPMAAFPRKAASRFLRTNWLHRLKVVIAPQTPNSKIWDGYRQERLLQRYRGRPDLVPIFIIDVFSKYLLRSQITFLALIPCQFPENRRFRHAQQRRYLFLVLLCFL